MFVLVDHINSFEALTIKFVYQSSVLSKLVDVPTVRGDVIITVALHRIYKLFHTTWAVEKPCPHSDCGSIWMHCGNSLWHLQLFVTSLSDYINTQQTVRGQRDPNTANWTKLPGRPKNLTAFPDMNHKLFFPCISFPPHLSPTFYLLFSRKHQARLWEAVSCLQKKKERFPQGGCLLDVVFCLCTITGTGEVGGGVAKAEHASFNVNTNRLLACVSPNDYP